MDDWHKHTNNPSLVAVNSQHTYMVRIGATRSREAMRIPSSAMRAVSNKAQVGSPLAFPWPKT